jgi:ERCC4 domain
LSHAIRIPTRGLPFLVRLPIDPSLILKVRDTWPRTSRVFCARVEGGWPAGAEILEEVPVALCRRRGVAIDLVLDRPRDNRSQFVFTTLPSGREGIFWQTRKVVTTARPGARIPGRRASGLVELVIVVDSREHYPYRFSKQQATTVRAALQAGDYAVMSEGGSPVAVVERKSLADLAGALNNGTLVFELAKLAEAPRATLVVEGRYGNLLKHAYTPAGFLPDMLARVQARYPEIPIVFLETRPLAEEWTFRYLGAALAEHESEQQSGPGVRAAELPLDYAPGRTRSRTRRHTGA